MNAHAAPLPPAPEDPRWRAVLERDAARDGDFVYAVASTGVYCRPSCPSRRPRREGVRLYPVPALAEADGFRACRRCTPTGASPRDERLALVDRACRRIERELERGPDADVRLDSLARAVGSSPDRLRRAFARVAGISPRAYADAVRERRLRRALRAGEGVLGATLDAGYGAPSRVYERADDALGMPPGRYGAGGPGERVRALVVEVALGALLVAATERGLCAVRLGDEPEALLAELRDELPRAEIAAADEELEAAAVAVAALADGRDAPDPGLALDVRATAFQRLVWEELRRVPRGEVRTYAQVADAIGRPTAVRAVARACATNPVALVVPCHRVVRSDGTPSGYRWGLERKRRLLAMERGEAPLGPDPEGGR